MTSETDACDHDEDGNLIAAPLGETPTAHTLEWDAENRLKAAYPTTPEAGSKKVEYTYDYMNRRVERIVTDWDPELGENGDWETTPSEHTRYVYHGWNVVLELDALDSNAITEKYTWGLDLAGQNGQVNSLDAAGGIGGLLACLDTAGTSSTGDDRTFVYSYDANGNVTQLVAATTGGNYGTLAAAYEYDAYGNTVVASGGYADDNLIRFSTKLWEVDGDLSHWGYRYGDHRVGRWTSRDPIEERGGTLLYGYVGTNVTNLYDVLGRGIGDTISCAACLARVALTQRLTGWGPKKLADLVLSTVTPIPCDPLGCKYDALQHCIGSALLAGECGDNCAVWAGAELEREQGNASTRDLWNNAIGAYGCKTKDPWAALSCCKCQLKGLALDTGNDSSDAKYSDGRCH